MLVYTMNKSLSHSVGMPGKYMYRGISQTREGIVRNSVRHMPVTESVVHEVDI